MKKCIGCLAEKNDDQFYHNGEKYLSSKCKECQSANNKEKYETHVEQYRLVGLEKYHKNRQRNIVKMKMRRDRNRLAALKHYSNGTLQCSQCLTNHVEFLNIDHINDNGAAHRKEVAKTHHGSAIFKWLKDNNYPLGFQVLCWNCNYLKHLVKLKTKPRTPKRDRTVYNKQVRREVLTHYSQGILACKCCGLSDEEVLTLDHVNNDGAKHRKDAKLQGGHQFNLKMRALGYPPILQVLCRNCNCAKGCYGSCPHQQSQTSGNK